MHLYERIWKYQPLILYCRSTNRATDASLALPSCTQPRNENDMLMDDSEDENKHQATSAQPFANFYMALPTPDLHPQFIIKIVHNALLSFFSSVLTPSIIKLATNRLACYLSFMSEQYGQELSFQTDISTLSFYRRKKDSMISDINCRGNVTKCFTAMCVTMLVCYYDNISNDCQQNTPQNISCYIEKNDLRMC